MPTNAVICKSCKLNTQDFLISQCNSRGGDISKAYTDYVQSRASVITQLAKVSVDYSEYFLSFSNYRDPGFETLLLEVRPISFDLSYVANSVFTRYRATFSVLFLEDFTVISMVC